MIHRNGNHSLVGRLKYYLWWKSCINHQHSLPVVASPSCLQTTVASVTSHISSHTVPHSLFKHISTRPSALLAPPASRTSPCVHPNYYKLVYHNVQSWHNKSTFCTYYTSIFAMITVVHFKGSMCAIKQLRLQSTTSHVSKENRATAFSKFPSVSSWK